jgi:glyoxylase-like metal-dependent hydrolase (beta-lactamase superfamily II)
MAGLRVHHINAATMCPWSASLINGKGGWFKRGRMVCHCLLVESEKGLILVDTGLGTDDVAEGARRLGRMFMTFVAPRGGREGTALARVEALGFLPNDVRHLIPTHLDLDHAGGFPDFPNAEIHVHATEHDAAMQRRTRMERERYKLAHWAHNPRWDLRDAGGEPWFGFEGVQAIQGMPDVLLIPLHGHTRGHCGVAVRSAEGWLLHAGDAYFHHGELDETPCCPSGLRMFQRLVAVDDERRRANQARLRELKRDQGAAVKILSAHCPVEFAAMTSGASASSTPSAAVA